MSNTVFKYRGAIITITEKRPHTRAQVENAVKLLRDKQTTKYARNISPSLDTNSYSASCGAYNKCMRQVAKKIVKNLASYRVTVKLNEPNKSTRALYARLNRGAVYQREYSFSVTSVTMRNILSDAIRRVKDMQRAIRDTRLNARYPGDAQDRSVTVRGTTVSIPSIIARTYFNTEYKRTAYSTHSFRYHTTPGLYVAAAQQIKAKEVFTMKTPKTLDKHVGVEIEFACKLGRKELGVQLYNAGLAKYVELKSDGSLNSFPDGYITHELVVCVSQSERRSIIERVASVINSVGAKVNKTCGLHVHLDMRNYDVAQAFNNLVGAQEILYSMVPVSRRNNNFCKKTLGKQFSKHRYSSNRYQGINPCAYNRHRTLEVRLHTGTTDATKINNWIDILTAVAYNPKKIVRSASTLVGFAKQHSLSVYIQSYIKGRIALFSNSTQEESA